MPSKSFTLFLVSTFFLFHFQKAFSQLVFPIIAPSDDVEEQANGFISVNSSDLELVDDYGNLQTVGLRFNHLQIPQGVTITGAWLQFTADEISAGPCNLNIQAHATGDAAPFTEEPQNISSRPLTTTSVNWQPESWDLIGEAGPRQKTPNLATVLQEILNRPDWAAGNSVAFIISGTGLRTAVAFEGYSSPAAWLIVETNSPPTTQVLEDVFINELMSAGGLVKDNFGENEDWIEIFNGSDQIISLEGLYLSDDASNLKKWQISALRLIPPGGFALLWLDGQPEQGGLHAPFKLSSEGGFLALSQELDGQFYVLDAFEFPAFPFNASYGRQEDGANEWVLFSETSSHSSNNGKKRYLDAEVKFSKPEGFYPSTLSLQLSTDDPEAVIFYTLDGSIPTLSSLPYTQALTLATHSIVRARAFKPGFGEGSVFTKNYFINPLHTLPVVCVQTDPENLWDNQKGIYIVGSNGIPGYCISYPRNWNQNWERPANITLFKPDGTKGFQVNAGIKIGGGCSRTLKMKSFNLYLRGKTYGNKSIDYQVFPNLGLSSFKRLKLRNSGNDWAEALFRDGMCQTILRHTVDLDLMAYQPAVLYLNGTYWGLYEIRELYNEDYLASHYGVNPDNLDIITNPQTNWPEINEGNYAAFQKIKTHIANEDLSKAANYEFLLPLMDMSEYINYHIVQIYLANSDWPANNVRVWRERNGGRFRWMLYDLDATTNAHGWNYALASSNTLAAALATNGPTWPNNPESTLFLRKLLKNEVFKNEFVQRTATYRKLIFSSQRINPMVDSIRQMLEPEMYRHINRWLPDTPDWGWGLPCGGSVTSWRNFIQAYKDFFPERSKTILQHYNTTLDLEGTFQLSFAYPPGTPGDLYLHSNEVKVPHNYTGDYFKNIPLKVKAVAHPGYRFVRWLETGNPNPEIELKSNRDTILTPIFSPMAPILTEIHYHPAEGEAFEFLEFYNAAGVPLQLDRFRLVQGPQFEFPAGTTLPADAHLLVVKDKRKYAGLSCQVFEWQSGSLDDADGTIELHDAQGLTVQKLSYSASGLWPREPDGGGASLSLKSPYLDNTIPQNWEASPLEGGTPCGQESPLYKSKEQELLLEVYPNPAFDKLVLKYAILSSEGAMLEVFNAAGQILRTIHLVQSLFFQTLEIPLGDWPAGTYFIRKKGGKKVLKKFVKS